MSFLRRPQSHLLRRAIFQIHLWTGVAVSLYVVFIGATGAALVFRPEMQKAAFREFFDAGRAGEPDAEPAEIMRQVQNRYPGYRFSGIDWPTRRRDTYISYVVKGSEFRTVFSHPVSGRVFGELPRNSWITTLQSLHFDLFSGSTGRTVNGIAAFSLIGMFVSGLVVWWPGIDRWRQSLWVDIRNGWKRINWDLHSAIGFWLFALLMLWAVTGVEFAFPRGFRSAVNAVSPLTVVRAPQSAVPHGTKLPAADPMALIAKARALEPGARMGRLVLPATDRAAVLILLAHYDHGDYDTSDERLFYFDQYSGNLLLRRVPAEEIRTAGDFVMAWIGPLHVGSFGGLPVKILWAILAMSFPLLAITGTLMWWNRVFRERFRKA